ncbi:hypothetical protein [Alkalibacterium olivapovliticus]|uniref:Uncharacterized protein n=1 Tax=Alkalibacterium olivapovliticus TaxID=99907 RepID=A0A2T0W3L0_9LACT|nr:hypothetical protein [Alkalibacterium olivapovliticus]PRY80066.1 hypothetical protein CLV38_1221 [Alkalibacterium olivapovliticus]
MDQFKLGSRIYQAIVDGTQNGYLEYLHERRLKKDEMRVSGAYAWTKGNHIDDQVARAVESLGLNYQMEKAGYTWEYLQFTLNEDAEKHLIIIKNSRRTSDFFDGKINSKKRKNYLTPLSDINSAQLKASGISFSEINEQIELELGNPAEIQAVMNHTQLSAGGEYSRFYIVTYEINEVTKMIDSIKLTMPNSETMTLVEVDDLTPFIESSRVDITMEDIAPIKSEISTEHTVYSGDDNAFGYSIPAEEESESEG